MITHRRKIKVTNFGKVMTYYNLKISDFLVFGAPRTQKVHQGHENLHFISPKLITHRQKIQVTNFGKVMTYNNLKISDFLVLGAPRTQKVHQGHAFFNLSAPSFHL
jgi:hypothetical protein